MARNIIRTTTVVAVLALLAASCGGDDDGGGVGDDGTANGGAEPAATSEPDTVAEPDEGDPDGGDGASDAPATTSLDEPTEPDGGDGGDGPDDIELTDSFTGVTADTITLGYTQIDFDQLRDEFGVDLDFQNAEPVLAVLVDELNERGGILDRQVEMLMGIYLPIGAASADEICIRFTEDDPVFAVLGGFGGMATDVNSCIVARHDTALIGGTWTPDQHAQATAPWLRVEMTLARRSIGFARLLGEHGHLDDVERIAIVNSTEENRAYLPDVAAALEASGTEVVLTGTVSGAAGDAEMRTLIERARAGGATAIFYSGLNPAMYPAFADYPEMRYFFEDATTTEESLRDFLGAGHQLQITSNGLYPKPYRENAELAECIDIVEARTDIVVADPNALADDAPNWWEAVNRACQHLRLFEFVATAAGPDLTNDTFRAAAEGLGEIRLPGLEVASLGPGKYDANDMTVLVEWDPSEHDGEGGWAPIGPPVAID